MTTEPKNGLKRFTVRELQERRKGDVRLGVDPSDGWMRIPNTDTWYKP